MRRDSQAVTLELGGKSPLIVFGDAKLITPCGRCWQISTRRERLFERHARVRASERARRLRGRLRSRAAAMRIGIRWICYPGGALISAEHMEKVLGSSPAVGAGRAAAYGRRAGDERDLATATSWRPRVRRLHDDMDIVRQEIFARDVVLEFAEEDEVIARANATEFGLPPRVTNDLTRAHRVIAQLQPHLLDQSLQHHPVELPFAASNVGSRRENGRAAIEHYAAQERVRRHGRHRRALLGVEAVDYVIVGAGSAGCVLADRLTEDGKDSVLVLEFAARTARRGSDAQRAFDPHEHGALRLALLHERSRTSMAADCTRARQGARGSLRSTGSCTCA